MNDNFCVYVLTFPDGRRYIGQTQQKPERRWACGKGYSETQPVRAAVDHFGWENVQHDVYASKLSKAEADSLEKRLIKLMKSTDPEHGYNVLPGGVVNRSGFKNTDEQNKKISEAHKKRVKQYDRQGNLIRIHASIMDAAASVGGTFRVVSATCCGAKKTAYGFVWRFDDDAFNKFDSEPDVGGVKGTPVIAFDDIGNVVARFRSSRHAAKMLDLDHSGILRCCRGRTARYGGYIWKFDGEDDAK